MTDKSIYKKRQTERKTDRQMKDNKKNKRNVQSNTPIKKKKYQETKIRTEKSTRLPNQDRPPQVSVPATRPPNPPARAPIQMSGEQTPILLDA